MAYRAALLTSLRAAIGAAWPEVVANGIVRTSQASRGSIDRRVAAGTFPFAAVEFHLVASDDWGGNTKTEEGQVLVYYVVSDAATDDDLETKLEALRDYLWTNDVLTNGQVTENPTLPDPKMTPLMEYFLSTQRAFVSGVLAVPVVAGEY